MGRSVYKSGPSWNPRFWEGFLIYFDFFPGFTVYWLLAFFKWFSMLFVSTSLWDDGRTAGLSSSPHANVLSYCDSFWHKWWLWMQNVYVHDAWQVARLGFWMPCFCIAPAHASALMPLHPYIFLMPLKYDKSIITLPKPRDIFTKLLDFNPIRNLIVCGPQRLN